MKIAKKILAIIIPFFGMFATYVLYSLNESGNLRTFGLIIVIGIGAICSVSIALFFHKKWGNSEKSFWYSIIYSYLSFICLYLLGGIFTDGLTYLAEALMWLPIMIIFMVPFASPVIFTSCAAVFLFFDAGGNKEIVKLSKESGVKD